MPEKPARTQFVRPSDTAENRDGSLLQQLAPPARLFGRASLTASGLSVLLALRRIRVRARISPGVGLGRMTEPRRSGVRAGALHGFLAARAHLTERDAGCLRGLERALRHAQLGEEQEVPGCFPGQALSRAIAAIEDQLVYVRLAFDVAPEPANSFDQVRHGFERRSGIGLRARRSLVFRTCCQNSALDRENGTEPL